MFYVLLAAIMVPGPSIMTAQYAMYHALGWRENGLVLIIPGLFGSIMTAFFIRQFLFGLPTSIIEAAKIDGAGYFRIFCGFILPLAMPAIMAQGLLSFMGCWNNYMGSYIMIPSTSTAINLPHALALLDSNGAGSYAGDYEIVSLLGTVTRMDGKFYSHLHMSAGDESGKVFGGHLNRACVSATCEAIIFVFNGEVGREFSDEVGLNLFKF